MTLPWTPRLLGTGFASADLWNAVVAAAGTRLPLGEAGSTLAFTLAEPFAPDASVLLCRLPPLAGTVGVQLLAFPFRERFGVDLDAADLGSLPEGLRTALVEGIVEIARALLPAGLGPRLTVEGQGLASTFPVLAEPRMQGFEVEMARADGLAMRLRLVCDRESVVRRVAEHLPAPFGRGASAAVGAVGAQILAPVDMTLGSIAMTLAELRALEPGSLAVLPAAAGARVILRAAGWLFEFADIGEGWRCSGPRPAENFAPLAAGPGISSGRSMDEAILPDEATQPPEEAPPLSLGDLRVAVDFDLGRSMLPLSAVAAWQAGAIVELNAPSLDDGLEVAIRVNGDVVGSGDIVRIDDRIAVRITRLALRA